MSSKQLTKRCCAYKSYILKSDVTAEEMKKKLMIIGTRKSKIIIIVLIQVLVVIIIITIKISVQEEKKLVSINLIKSI